MLVPATGSAATPVGARNSPIRLHGPACDRALDHVESVVVAHNVARKHARGCCSKFALKPREAVVRLQLSASRASATARARWRRASRLVASLYTHTL